MTMHRVVLGALLAASVGNGLVGGVFLAFSSFIMPAFARLPAAGGVAAMQAINVAVLTSAFMALFLATTVASGVLALGGLARLGTMSGALAAAAGLLAVLGGFGVTLALNVPLNDALARAVASTAEAADTWSRYLSSWTLWNTVRAGACTAAALLFALALLGVPASVAPVTPPPG